MLTAIQFAALVAVLGAAAWSDVRTSRIPNRLTVAGLLVGLSIGAAGGADAMVGSLQAVGVAFALGFVLFIGQIMGGGDVKLLIATGALLGMERFVAALVLTALAGGALAILVALRRGVLLPALSNSRDTLVWWATLGRSAAPQGKSTGTSIPYAVAIAAGGIGAWFA